MNIDLAEATLYIAKIEYPLLDADVYLKKLDTMAAELSDKLPSEPTADIVISVINEYLFKQLGYSGNWRKFNDPRNSFLNDVIDRKLGIPISLSLIYMEMGKRLGLEIYGISFPGHFLTKLIFNDEQYIIDPFSGGIILTMSELRERLQQFSVDRQNKWNLNELLEAASNIEMLNRMLRNLRTVYLEKDKLENALAVTNLHLILEPDSADGLRDRGFIYESLDCYRAAREDYQRYLFAYPDAHDCMTVQSRLMDLQNSISRLH
jgi:regulator of sirC expression with transglutaminase-like and TPR domain